MRRPIKHLKGPNVLESWTEQSRGKDLSKANISAVHTCACDIGIVKNNIKFVWPGGRLCKASSEEGVEEAGLDLADVEVQNVQHADGFTALNNGSVDAWSGLDPIMAGGEADTEFLYHNVDLNTYSFLNATE